MRALNNLREFVLMWISGVDPFAIYEAEKQLSAAMENVDRRVLAEHYRVRGRLDTLVARALDQSMRGEQVDLSKASGDDFVAYGGEGWDNPILVNPWAWASIYSIYVLLMVTAVWWYAAPKIKGVLPGSYIHTVLVTVASIGVSGAIAYCHLAARYGRKFVSRKTTAVLFLLLTLGIGLAARFQSALFELF